MLAVSASERQASALGAGWVWQRQWQWILQPRCYHLQDERDVEFGLPVVCVRRVGMSGRLTLGYW